MNAHVHHFRPWSDCWNVCECGEKQRIHAKPDDHPKNAHPQPQPALCHEPLAAHEAENSGANRDGRIQVKVVSYRRRLLDEDNLCPKYAIDALRYAGLLPSDAPDRVSIETRQEKVETAQDECTVIELSAPDPAHEAAV